MTFNAAEVLSNDVVTRLKEVVLYICADCQASGAKPVYQGIGYQRD